MPRYLIAIGSSHSDGQNYLRRALLVIESDGNFSICGASRVYQNSSADTTYNRLFYNGAVAIKTPFHPQVFYRELARIEQTLGRIRTYRNAPRTIDIDVLMSLDFTYKSGSFFLPHREAMNRNFFVMPAIEALKSASWPVSLSLRKASSKCGRGYLCPLPQARI